MVAELIAVGTELLLGNIANTDAQVISQGLSELGIDVYFHCVVGDNAERLAWVLENAKKRADIIITTGGLGPTYDDMTKQTVCQVFNRRLVRHEPTWARIQAFFDRLGRVPTPNNEQQAMLPEGCAIFENDWGTAPGCALAEKGVHVLMLPGPPRECTAMFRHCAMPYLAKLSHRTLCSRQIRIFGMGESEVEHRLRELMERSHNPTVAPYAKEGEVMLRVTASAQSSAQALAMTEPVVADIRRVLGDAVYGVDVDTLEQVVLSALTAKHMTLAVAESCTGGLIQARLTSVPGASAVFAGGVVAYQNSVKAGLLGVDEQLLREYGAVSEPVAKAMAQNVRQKTGADIAVSVTGLAGPGGGEQGVPVGTVWLGLSTAEGTLSQHHLLGSDRRRIQVNTSGLALNWVRKTILNT